MSSLTEVNVQFFKAEFQVAVPDGYAFGAVIQCECPGVLSTDGLVGFLPSNTNGGIALVSGDDRIGWQTFGGAQPGTFNCSIYLGRDAGAVAQP